MNLNQLRAFYMVIKTGSFSGAAEELCVTEPAVFIQVRSLERLLGFTLLDKFGKELRPTEAGRILYDYGEKIFTLVEEATKAVQELQDLKKGSLRLGVTQALAQYLMPLLISVFQDKYPHIAVYMDGSSSRACSRPRPRAAAQSPSVNSGRRTASSMAASRALLRRAASRMAPGPSQTARRALLKRTTSWRMTA
ncbi:MAG: LysR family transcriptional regulator [Syntrophobacteraceae bacterium]|nr:LysR family transcriptional regulator [Syntrophobacteraceae bacterium]